MQQHLLCKHYDADLSGLVTVAHITSCSTTAGMHIRHPSLPQLQHLQWVHFSISHHTCTVSKAMLWLQFFSQGETRSIDSVSDSSLMTAQ